MTQTERDAMVKKASPLPWRVNERDSTIWDAVDTYVLDTWWQDAAFIVERVNAHDGLVAEVARLQAEVASLLKERRGHMNQMRYLSDVALVAGKTMNETDVKRGLVVAVDSTRRLLDKGAR